MAPHAGQRDEYTPIPRDETSIGWLSVSRNTQRWWVTHPVGRHIVRGRITPIRLDCDPSIAHLANPDVGKTSSIDGTCSDDLQVSLSQPTATWWQERPESTSQVDERARVCHEGAAGLQRGRLGLVVWMDVWQEYVALF